MKDELRTLTLRLRSAAYNCGVIDSEPHGSDKKYSDAEAKAHAAFNALMSAIEAALAAQAPQTSIEASQTTNWRINIDHAPIPILATDYIDDMPTGRDDMWIATTPHLRAPQARAAQPLTDGQISKMYAKWDKKAGTSIADLIRMVEAHHGIAPPAPSQDRK